MFGIFLMLWLGMAQAVHRHGNPLSASAKRICAAATADHGLSEGTCPLCAVMHSVLPVSAREAWSWEYSAVREVPAQSSRVERLWDFSLYGRPPPAFPV